jgi:hypothetical protein
VREIPTHPGYLRSSDNATRSPALAMPLPLRMLTRNGAAASALTEKKTKNLGKQVIENQAYHTY